MMDGWMDDVAVSETWRQLFSNPDARSPSSHHLFGTSFWKMLLVALKLKNFLSSYTSVVLKIFVSRDSEAKKPRAAPQWAGTPRGTV
jgi:hypothetical protein